MKLILITLLAFAGSFSAIAGPTADMQTDKVEIPLTPQEKKIDAEVNRSYNALKADIDGRVDERNIEEWLVKFKHDSEAYAKAIRALIYSSPGLIDPNPNYKF
jgi:hypothetical protein